MLYALNIVLAFFHRLLTSESGVVQPFLVNESGFISSHRGLPIAWSIGVLVIGAALLGTPQKADAGCGYLPNCSSDSSCTSRCINVTSCSNGQCEWVEIDDIWWYACSCW